MIPRRCSWATATFRPLDRNGGAVGRWRSDLAAGAAARPGEQYGLELRRPPADPTLIYASSVSGQVYRSTDGGEGWEKLPREFGEIRALLWTP
jgi:photosystem II stability/assembly factor-like uncharacterized protein